MKFCVGEKINILKGDKALPAIVEFVWSEFDIVGIKFVGGESTVRVFRQSRNESFPEEGRPVPGGVRVQKGENSSDSVQLIEIPSRHP
jgi:hypothetical protein